MVIELKMGDGTWQSFMAERLPVDLGNAIRCHRAAVFRAQKEGQP